MMVESELFTVCIILHKSPVYDRSGRMEEGMEIRLSTNICTTVGCRRPKVGAVCRVKYPDTTEKLTFVHKAQLSRLLRVDRVAARRLVQNWLNPFFSMMKARLLPSPLISPATSAGRTLFRLIEIRQRRGSIPARANPMRGIDIARIVYLCYTARNESQTSDSRLCPMRKRLRLARAGPAGCLLNSG